MATKITVNVGVTKNMGNYESLRLDESMTIEVREGVDVKKAKDNLVDYLDAQVAADVIELGKKFKKRK